MTKKFLAFAAFSLLLVVSCKRKEEAIQVSGWTRYQDPYFLASFSQPVGWYSARDGNRVGVYSDSASVEKFFDPRSKGTIGAQLLVSYQKVDSLKTLDAFVDAYTEDLKSSGFTVLPTESKQLGTVPAKQVSYGGRFTEDTKMQAIRLIAFQDTLVYTLGYTAFNELYTPNKFLLDSLIASFEFPRPKSAAVEKDPTMPSENLQNFENNFIKVSFPENFDPTFPQAKGEQAFAMDIRGMRLDCNIHIDALPAKGLTVEKVFDQNSKKFPKAGAKGETTIDGLKAIYVNYAGGKDIESRVYFFVKQDKVYRVILNYFQPRKKDFLPVFEKTVASLHIK